MEPSEGRARRPAGPTRREALDGVTAELAGHGIEPARTEAERLVAAALEVSRAALTTEGGVRLEPDEARRVARAVGRRTAGEPLQHIEGTAEFRELVLVSDRRALIPRPETEELVDRIGAWLGDRPAARALDVGIGSGALGLSLLVEGLAERVVGVDVSGDALEQARENAVRAGVEGRLELRRCDADIWPAIAREAPFDMVVSNPPYIASRDIRGLAPEIRDHEPRVALDGGAEGLDVLHRVIDGAAAALRPGGGLFLEIGATQAPAVRARLEAAGAWSDVEIHRDLSGRERFAVARAKGREHRGS